MLVYIEYIALKIIDRLIVIRIDLTDLSILALGVSGYP